MMDFEPGRRDALRIRVGRLLDGTGAPAVEDAAILVIDGLIAAVGRDDGVSQPEDARTLDLPGTTALPGLMDGHVHVTLPGGHCHFFGGEADGVAGVREAVRRLLDDEGADGIKIMSTGGGMTAGTDSRHASYSIEELAAAADEAHRLGAKVTSHAHGVPGIDNASKAGIDSIQHCTMLGKDWEWAFDETVARGLVERGTRAIPTISAGTRYEVETGKRIDKLQPNPGRMTRA